MTWILVGYYPKRRMTRLNWKSPYPEYPDAVFPAPQPVEEICSVSGCVAQGPRTPMEEVPFNQFGGYESPATAWQAVVPDLRLEFDLFAFRIAPILFRDGEEEPLELPSLDIEPVPTTFVCLGFDAVELTHGQCLGCSPLSCNGQTGEGKVNRYCLVNTPQEGLDLARRFSITRPEPGPYCAVEVWRDARSAESTPAVPQ